MEFGPRALGARSILADPRQQATKERVNVLKGRQWWRPFGPSILSGREADWFETPMHSPFMLFTLPVLYITGVLAKDKATDGVYDCPVYRSKKRTGLHFITTTTLRTEDPATKWIMRGVALLFTTD